MYLIYALFGLICSAKVDCPTYDSPLDINLDSTSVDTYEDCTFSTVSFSYSGTTSKAIPANLFTSCRIRTLTIPNEVTEIRSSAFYDCKINSISISISNSKLGKILSNAFYGLTVYTDSYTTFNFPDSLTEIGESAFEGSKNVDFNFNDAKLINIGRRAFYGVSTYNTFNFNFNLPTSLKIINGNAFQSSNIYSITIPKKTSLETIGEYAFANTENLNSVNSLYQATQLTTIGNGAFYESGSSYSLYLPQNLQTIGSDAFSYDDSHSNYYHDIYVPVTFPQLEIIGDKAFLKQNLNLYQLDEDGNLELLSNNEENKFTFPSTLTDIGESAFQNLKSSSITVDFSKATSLVNIGDKAFYEIYFDEYSDLNLNSQSIKLIGSHAFHLNNKFERTFTITSLNNLEKIGNNPFDNQIVNFPDTIAFPANLEYIGDNAFYRQISEEGSKSTFYSKSISSISFQQTKTIIYIGDNAFKNQDSLIISTNIKAHVIGNEAFAYCSKLNTDIEILPIDLIAGRIGDQTFYNCISLTGTLNITNPTVPEGTQNPSLSSIGKETFRNSNLKTINLPHMSSIGGNAFQNCIQLQANSKELEVDTIADSAFKDCTSLALTSITTKSIGPNAFENCHQLGANIIILDGGNIAKRAFYCCDKLGTLTYDRSFIDDQHKYTEQTIDDYAFWKSGLTGPLTIPFFINEIKQYAFANCENLVSLNIESNLTTKQEIQDHAFYYAKFGSNLVIPRSVVYIGTKAFAFTIIETLEIQGSTYLELINLNPTPIGIDVSSNAFYFCNKLKKVTLGDGYIDIQSNTFKGCPIETIDLGQIEKIPDEAFYGVTTLTKINIPDNVTSIGARAFAECSGIETISFTENSHLDTINAEAFYRCTNLATTSIPRRVTKINARTYYKCSKLPLLNIPCEVTDIDSYAFYQCSSFAGTLILPAELTTIGISAFEGTSVNGELSLPDSLEHIYSKAFNGCESLTGGLLFGRSIITIGDSAFRDCKGFNRNLKFQEFLTTEHSLTISDYAFCGCSGFTGGLELPKNVIVNSYAFRDCTGFNGELSLPSTLETINEGVFYNCHGFIGEIPLHDVKEVKEYAFYDCYGFNGSIDLNQVQTVSDYAFYNCRGLNGELISTSLSTVQQYAFYGCSNLKGNLNCESFTQIFKYAFYGCSGLTGPMLFKAKLQKIEEYAFAGCSGFSDHLSFKVKGTGSLLIEQRAFQGCSGFKNGRLTFTMTSIEEQHSTVPDNYYFRYDYFLRIGNEAFEGTKFKDIYYLGRFEPDCDYDIGISRIKGIHTSSNYANKTFCSYPLHKSKLSGGAIAGIVIACIVVVAAIVVLIVWLILRNKKNKDKSEAEVEMNQDP